MKKEPTLSFKSKEDKNLAADEFQVLKNLPAWKRIIDYYDRKIRYLEKLLYEGELKDMNELKLIRARRNMAIQFRNLPDILVEFLTATEGNKINLDPYD